MHRDRGNSLFRFGLISIVDRKSSIVNLLDNLQCRSKIRRMQVLLSDGLRVMNFHKPVRSDFLFYLLLLLLLSPLLGGRS